MPNTKAQAAPTKLLRGHVNGYGLTFVAFLSDDHIISASEDKTIRRFSLSNGHNEVLKEGIVCAVMTSPSKRWLATGGRDGRVRLVGLESPSEIKKSNARHAQVIQSLSFSPDSNRLASGAQDGTVFVWSSETLQPVAGPFQWHKDSVWHLCYSPDGKKIASCDREAIHIWESATRIGLTIYEQAWSLAWSSDSGDLFVGCIDGTVKRYDSDGVLCASSKEHIDVVFSIAVSHSGKFITTASWDKTVRFFDAATFQLIGPTLKHDSRVHSISLSPDDSYLVSGARDHIIRVWHLRTVSPALFLPTLLEPLRRETVKCINPHRPTVAIPNDSHIIDDHDLISPQSEASDQKSTKSDKSKQSFIDIILGRKRGGTLDSQRTPSPSTPGSSHVDSPQTDRLSTISVYSMRLLEESTDHVSPVGSTTDHASSPVTIFVNDSENWSFIREIRSIPNHDLSGRIVPEGDRPVTGGSHGDIYRGALHVNGKTMRVAIKAIKQYLAQGDDESKKRRLRREIRLWLTLDHKNVVPLLGITAGYGDLHAMVCPWVENGQLTSYLKNHGNELTAQRRWGIINDVALGLEYLHSKFIVHGDISGSNILIYGCGRACISDFGLSIVSSNIEESSLALTYQIKGTLYWTAPELFVGCDSDSEDEIETPTACKVFPTVESDIYSFGGIMLQVLSGKRPYHHLSRDQAAVLAILRGEHPKRPSSTSVVTDEQWEFMTQCWSLIVTDRPSDAYMVKFVHDQLLIVVASSSLAELTLQTPTRSNTSS